jgi:hypothetical protein
MSPVMGGFILFALTPAGRYEAIEKFSDKTKCESIAWQATLKLRKESKFDSDGHYVENGMAAYLCVRQTMHFPPANEKRR